MQNDQGKFIDLYYPRKCSATNMVLGPKDHASVQINVAKLNESGVYTGEYQTVALSGFVRLKGESDFHLKRLVQ
ncbi:hypothetical protein RCL1_004012 [Eukaryota sp. TZLM3-RCL]